MMNKILTSLSKLFLPGIRLKRWLLVMIIGLVSLILFFMSTFGKAVANVFDFLESKLALIFSLGDMGGGQKLLVKVALLLIGLGCLYLGTKHIVGRLIDALMPEKKGKIAHLLYKSSELNQGKNVVVIGGGTGLNSILTGLKQYTNNITAIITIADEGRSSRILRNEFGMLPPGDFRNCLVALSDSGPLMAKLLQYRFQKGKGLKGHPLGNLLITAMTHLTGDFEKGLEEIEKILSIRGKVLPVSVGKTSLCAVLENGKTIREEPNVEEHKTKYKSEIKKLFLDPPVSLTKKARDAILHADLIVLGPGSLYTSILPNILVKGVVEAIKEAKNKNGKQAKVSYVCNVMTQPGETDYYTASDHVERMVQYLGVGVLDFVVLNDEKAPEQLYEKYKKEGAQRVKFDKESLHGFEEQYHVKVVLAKLMTKENLLRHDPDKLARAVLEL